MSRLAIVLLACLLCYAQSPLGTVTGVATDPTEAVIPNAKITIRNLDTGVQNETNTNAAGVYSLPNLPPGNYVVNGVAAGFYHFQSLKFALQAFRTFRLDIRFLVGGDAIAVDVAASLIQTDTPQINSSLTTKQVLELP